MNSRVDQARATRERLIEIARALFAERGYEATSLEQVQRRAGVSRGALYHHFTSKKKLFEAVLDTIETEIAARVAGAAEGRADPVDRLRAGSLAWLDFAADEAIQRISLLDAPSVLGWETQRAIDERHTLGMIRTALAEAEQMRLVPVNSIEPLSHALPATLNELALFVARAPDRAAAKASVVDLIEIVLGRLFAAPHGEPSRG
jgi:AcrR family transcriptional regulator